VVTTAAAWVKARAARFRRKPGAVPEPGGKAFIVVTLIMVVIVAAIAFSASYQHQYELDIFYRQTHWVAAMLPLTVDGLIVAAGLTIWTAARYGYGRPLGAYLALFAGVGATVVTNLAADQRYHWPWVGPGISVWPAGAFVAAYEMAVWLVRKRQDAARKALDRDTAATAGDSSATPATGSAKVRDILKASPALSKADVAELAGVSERTVERVKQKLNGAAG
jgi:hypothetical protein